MRQQRNNSAIDKHFPWGRRKLFPPPVVHLNYKRNILRHYILHIVQNVFMIILCFQCFCSFIRIHPHNKLSGLPCCSYLNATWVVCSTAFIRIMTLFMLSCSHIMRTNASKGHSWTACLSVFMHTLLFEEISDICSKKVNHCTSSSFWSLFGDLWRVDAGLQTCLSAWQLHYGQSVPVLFTPIRGIYSQCLSVKLQDISLLISPMALRNCPTWALEGIRNLNCTASHWAFRR